MAEYEVRPEYCYTKGDTWVCRLADGTIRFGITDYAQKKLKEIEYLNLPEPGEAVCQGESLGEVESKKSVSDLMSPLTGIVLELNNAAEDDPGLLNRDPYGAGWILSLSCSDYETQAAGLLDAETYRQILQGPKQFESG